LADNLQLTSLSNSNWREKFKSSLQTELNNGIELAAAMDNARTVADAGQYLPGTKEFDDLKNTITSINNWDHASIVSGAPASGGAWLKQMSRLYHVDAQWDLSKYVKIFDLLVGADARIYEVIPDGNNFVDFTRPVEERNQPLADGSFGDNVYYKKYGAFAQATKLVLNDKLKLTGSLRFDHNLEFNPKLNPRVAAVYTVADNHNFRASYQNGFRFPSLFEALSFVNNGNVRRVGGLPFINEGLGYLDNSYTLASVNTFNASVNESVNNGSTVEDASNANRDLLVKSNLSTMRPERINAFEIGYKGLLSNTLALDVDVYTSQYDGFLGQVEVSVPTSGVVGSNEAVNDMLATNRSRQKRYRVFTNAKNTYQNYGAAIGLTNNFYKTFIASANLSYNNITKSSTADVFVTAFNTPNWVTNISIGNRELTKRIGFNIVWRWQESFLWQSPLANGTVPAYNTLDAQVTFKIPTLLTTVKVGGTNILNQGFIQYAAGPTIGGLYYFTLTFDLPESAIK
jgi:outer membrane receptor protein involved in Fe transport